VQAHFAKYEPTILELKRKYEAAMKEKMLAGLDRDKMAARVSQQRMGNWTLSCARLACTASVTYAIIASFATL
jgi:hypothetical protein